MELAGASAVSPDGTRVAYNWQGPGGYDLRVVGIDGGEPRVLYGDERVPYIEPQAWSPDGEQILAHLRTRDEAWQIVLVAATDGSLRVLTELGRRPPGKSRFSPDGLTIAYDSPPSDDVPQHDIFSLTVDRSHAAPLVQHPADDRLRRLHQPTHVP